jgi:acetyl-CoA C-acetyltransferase
VDFVAGEGLLMAPTVAVARMLADTGLSLQDFDFYEIHEAFAGQVLATFRAIESDQFAKEKLGLGSKIGSIDLSRTNPHGGSIPLGHPFGATGTRMILQTAYGLKTMNKKFGLISICAAGGLGSVMILENRN